MHYYVDGYNLLFRLLHAGDDLRTQRQALIQDLQSKVNLLKLEATLVFDSHYQPDEGSRAHLGLLEIIYTNVGETADEFILHELKGCSKPAEHTVITSDKKLAWLARRRLAKTESVEDFVALLNKRYRNKLRQNKEAAKIITHPPLTKLEPVVSPPKPKALPTTQASAEQCFDFYLETFEKEVTEVVAETAATAAKRKEKLKKRAKLQQQQPQDPVEAHLSDLERWQKAFERKESGENKHF